MFLPVTDCPDDKYLNKHVREKVCAAGTTKWRDLGIALMGQDAVSGLDVIRTNHPNNVEERCSRMFSKWQQETTTASWEKLLDALKEVNLIQLASELEELLSIEQGNRISQQQQPLRLQELGGMVELRYFV